MKHRVGNYSVDNQINGVVVVITNEVTKEDVCLQNEEAANFIDEFNEADEAACITMCEQYDLVMEPVNTGR